MTTRIKTYIAAAVAVLGLTAGAPMLMAQDQQPHGRGPGFGGPGPGMRMRGPGGPGGPMGFGLPIRQLNLSNDQKDQLKKIAESHRDEFRAAGDKVRTAREGMRALTDADNIDENAIRAKSAEIAAAEADVLILNAKVRHESLQILTAEQQAKLKELRDKGPRQRRPRQ
jgi:protein CpxP